VAGRRRLDAGFAARRCWPPRHWAEVIAAWRPVDDYLGD
jgi:hypothetical protein